MRVIQLLCLSVGVYGQGDVYWGSYELNIPGGSGSGNAVKDLKLPENAPEFFQFAAFNSQPFAAPQFSPVVQSVPQPAPAPQQAPLRVQQQARPAVPKPAPQAVQPAPLRVQQQQLQPSAPQPQQLRVFQPRPTARQPQRIRPTQSRQLAPQPAPRVPETQASPRFQNFAPRTVARPAAPAIPVKSEVVNEEVNEVDTSEEAPVDISKLSRFQLYKLRQKLKKQKEAQVVEAKPSAEEITEKSEDIQETTAAPVKVAPKRARAGIRRKAIRRKLVRNNA